MCDYTNFISKFQSINTAKKFSSEKTKKIEDDLDGILSELKNDDFTIITTGSYGREEASEESDLDLFIFCSNTAIAEELKKKQSEIEAVINRHISKQVGSTGTFGANAINIFDEILENIGGKNDSNETLTRRMLFLLEGKALYNKGTFERYRKSLLKNYVASTTNSNRIDKFLLNDIIRYYRTITTDFQYKVDQDSKAWGLRNIKLRFSRKILYFAGILTIAESAKKPESDDKLENISLLLNTPVLERVYEIAYTYVANNNTILPKLDSIFGHYESFLMNISNSEKRKELEAIEKKEDRLKNHLYLELSECSNDFTKELYELLDNLYDTQHPIHLSMAF
ncbi:TPA: nucleotidyltransferase domain-containing protein [Citrobacter freundii]|nr:nucleotidyltransferase domain-containing protein [Citrobacter freundii]HEJ0095602.1 nucleotidyltransferase domain-containing protein [Citrobacter freundii]